MRRARKLLAGILTFTMLLGVTAQAAPTSSRALEQRPQSSYGRIMITERNMLPDKNPRSTMVMGRGINYGDAMLRESVKIQTKTPNGRNLLVPESTENQGKRITIKDIPRAEKTPDNILSLPDNGSELEELISAPEGEIEDIYEPVVDEEKVEEIAEEADTSSRYPYLSVYGNVSSSDYTDFTKYMDRIIKEDPELVNTAVNSGWTIVLSGEDLDSLLFDGNTNGVEGCTYFPKDGQAGTIYVQAGSNSYCVIHEFGHVLDYLLSFPSQGTTFSSIYANESANLTEYGKTSPLEFFAEIYMYSILQPETTKTACPSAYEYIDSCRDEIINRAA